MARTGVRTGRLAGLAAAVGVAVLLVGGAASGRAGAEAPGSVHVVARGDTLWEVARAIVGPEGDPRPVVHELRELNGLGPGSTIRPGLRLVLPAA